MDKLWHDIEKYRSGALSAAEMHALEKKALTDPFLADALEGAGDFEPAAFSADIAELQNRLHERTRVSSKVIPLRFWVGRIAAGLAFLAISSFLLFKFFGSDKNKPNHLALNQENTPPPALPRMDSVIVDLDEETEVSSEAETAPQSTPAPIPAPPLDEPSPLSARAPQLKETHRAAASRKRVAAPDQPTSPDAVMHSLDPPEEELIQADSEKISVSLDAPKLAAVMESRSALKYERMIRPEARIIRGQVVDEEEGKGLPGVNVTIRGTSTGTVTDAEGYFKIPLEDLNAGLVFSFIGFESTEVVPGSKNEVHVALQQDVSQLSEVVVVGYGERKAGYSEPYSTLELAEPEGGKKAFKQYLENNLRYPEQALNSKIEGKVTVQFTIESTGDLSDFKILKGLGYGCDEEAIRLIKSGPKWSATKRNTEPVRDKVKVRLKFALPKK